MARTGRPRGFDRDKAVGQAMHLFWEHGFEGVSLEQLRQSMGGISSASFYAAFGSKEALYRTALEDYRATHGKVVLALHDEGLSPRQRIEQALRRSAEMQTDPAHPTGCMVTLSSTICSVDGESVQALTLAERVANRAAIRACVDAAIEDGTLRHDTNPAGLTTLFDGFLVGLSLQARDGVSHEDLDAGVTQALAAWDANSGRP
ncbi:TetR/AcrR family transcriptional regulator [Sphingomonas sp. CFBP 13733]|uniref:TetR/AcrR family transcriptional regulator n=1 Tax=Sphingomonas sp. CFBP 13733 TaxID=2775291 RepID=UPI001786A90D|nr:TetR/AcrR family transcriptional regulator [Sphingomonas sp. CFBP 13733]MBD8637864.1 TetR/AcrR family transcriptional regulator [Sphingomonas sp. CFBP 13733]